MMKKVRYFIHLFILKVLFLLFGPPVVFNILFSFCASEAFASSDYCEKLGEEIDRKVQALFVIDRQILELEKDYATKKKQIIKNKNIFRGELSILDKFSNIYIARCKN